MTHETFSTQPNALEQDKPSTIEALKRGHLDASATSGCLADRILIEGNGGQWHVPLIGGIDVVDPVDHDFMQHTGVDVVPLSKVTERKDPEDDGRFAVRWTGTDDALRSAEIDPASAVFVPYKD